MKQVETLLAGLLQSFEEKEWTGWALLRSLEPCLDWKLYESFGRKTHIIINEDSRRTRPSGSPSKTSFAQRVKRGERLPLNEVSLCIEKCTTRL